MLLSKKSCFFGSELGYGSSHDGSLFGLLLGESFGALGFSQGPGLFSSFQGFLTLGILNGLGSGHLCCTLFFFDPRSFFLFLLFGFQGGGSGTDGFDLQQSLGLGGSSGLLGGFLFSQGSGFSLGALG